MTEPPHNEAIPRQGTDLTDPLAGHSTHDDRIASLRGASAVSVGRKFWLFAGAITLAIFAVALVVSFVSIANDNARITRMKDHGVPVYVTVTNCAGNVGGSGSNGAGYTCRGKYTVGTTTYHELIGSMVTFSATGSQVRGVVDPSHHSTVVLASAVRTSAASSRTYVAPGLLIVVLLALILGLFRIARRPEPRTSPPTT